MGQFHGMLCVGSQLPLIFVGVARVRARAEGYGLEFLEFGRTTAASVHCAVIIIVA